MIARLQENCIYIFSKKSNGIHTESSFKTVTGSSDSWFGRSTFMLTEENLNAIILPIEICYALFSTCCGLQINVVAL